MSPVAAAAAGVTVPSTCPGLTSRGKRAGSMPAAARISLDHVMARMSSTPIGSAEAVEVAQSPVSRKATKACTSAITSARARRSGSCSACQIMRNRQGMTSSGLPEMACRRSAPNRSPNCWT